MPSGKVHSFSTIALAAGTGITAFRSGIGDIHTAALTGGVLAGLLLTPDLDVNGGSISNNHARKMGGWGFGLLWAILWTPYSYAIPHRSPLSHLPVLGTVFRLAYLAGFGYIVAGLLHMAGLMTIVLPPWWPWAFAGLVLSDTLHFLMDITLRN